MSRSDARNVVCEIALEELRRAHSRVSLAWTLLAAAVGSTTVLLLAFVVLLLLDYSAVAVGSALGALGTGSFTAVQFKLHRVAERALKRAKETVRADCASTSTRDLGGTSPDTVAVAILELL